MNDPRQCIHTPTPPDQIDLGLGCKEGKSVTSSFEGESAPLALQTEWFRSLIRPLISLSDLEKRVLRRRWTNRPTAKKEDATSELGCLARSSDGCVHWASMPSLAMDRSVLSRADMERRMLALEMRLAGVHTRLRSRAADARPPHGPAPPFEALGHPGCDGDLQPTGPLSLRRPSLSGT